jgi:transcriptional regulator with XRE-family HTH domain
MTINLNLNEVLDRIKELEHKESDHSIAELLGISRTALSERKRKNSIPYSELVRYCETRDVSIDWLFTGEGPACRSKIVEQSKLKAPIYLDLLKEIITSLEYILLNEKINIKPGKKADLIAYLYDQSLDDDTYKALITNKLELLVRLASDYPDVEPQKKAAG